jgi:hypothetical protein
MSYFKLYEDPMYDDDGQLVDEDDSDEGDWEDDEEAYSPHGTVNS